MFPFPPSIFWQFWVVVFFLAVKVKETVSVTFLCCNFFNELLDFGRLFFCFDLENTLEQMKKHNFKKRAIDFQNN